MASYCMHRSSITTILRSHRLSAHQHHGGLMDDCMSLTCYLAIDIDAYSLCVRPGVTPRSTATIILLNPVRIIWVKLLSPLQAVCPTSLRRLLALGSSKSWYTSPCPQGVSLTLPAYTRKPSLEKLDPARIGRRRSSSARSEEREKAFGNWKANGCLHVVSKKLQKSSNCAMTLGRVYACL